MNIENLLREAMHILSTIKKSGYDPSTTTKISQFLTKAGAVLDAPTNSAATPPEKSRGASTPAPVEAQSGSAEATETSK